MLTKVKYKTSSFSYRTLIRNIQSHTILKYPIINLQREKINRSVSIEFN